MDAAAPPSRVVVMLVAELVCWSAPVLAIAGGAETVDKEFPYVAALSECSELIHFRLRGTCTAIILTEEWLLTAAHCYSSKGRSDKNPYLTDVYAGTVDALECGLFCQHRESHTALIHPKYRVGVSRSLFDDSRHNDLALLRVDKPFFLEAPFVRTAIRSSAPTAIRSCTLVGFGMGGVGRFGFAPGRMLTAGRVPVLPAKLCPSARYAPLPKAALCSDSKIGVAPCLGDAGGPVICDGLVVGMAVGVYESRWEYNHHVFYCGFFKSCSFFGLYTSLEPFDAWIDGVVFRTEDAPAVNAANVSDPDML